MTCRRPNVENRGRRQCAKATALLECYSLALWVYPKADQMRGKADIPEGCRGICALVLIVENNPSSLVGIQVCSRISGYPIVGYSDGPATRYSIQCPRVRDHQKLPLLLVDP